MTFTKVYYICRMNYKILGQKVAKRQKVHHQLHQIGKVQLLHLPHPRAPDIEGTQVRH